MGAVFFWNKYFHYICNFSYSVRMDNDLIYKLMLVRTAGIGPVRYNELVSKFGSPAAAAQALANADAIRDVVRREIDRATAAGIQYISDDMPQYPHALRQMKNHPPVLSVRGNVDTLAKNTVAIVGTRHATAAGMNLVAEIACAFAAHGVAVVSGMAMGTDTAAHRGALRADGAGQTIAVLAGGVDYIWPLENESLYWEIVERGAVVSEMPVGFVPIATNFVQRNRWIAGIGEKLIISEADMNSGSMKTARFAMGANREIWAVPSHPSDSRAFGPNSLIQTGCAKLCNGVADFFAQEKNNTKNKKNNISDNVLLDALGTIPVSESVLAEIVKKSISEIKTDLVVMELQGLVRKVDGGYVRA